MKKNKTFKRFLAFLLCAAMIVTYMPTSVYTLADETEGAPAVEQQAKEESAPAPKVEKTEEPSKEADTPKEEAEPEKEEPAQTEATEPEPSAQEATDPAEDVTPADEATGEPVDEQTKEPEPEVEYPEQSFDEALKGVHVYVDAPEGALPEGTRAEMAIVPVGDVEDAVKDAMGGDVQIIKAVDITFYYKDGDKPEEKIEPKKEVSVKFVSNEFKKVDEAAVVHIDDNGDATKVADKYVDAEGKNVEFEVKDFSIYAVVETGEDAILTVNFNNGNTVIATVYVKERDTLENLNRIVYDPGTGDVGTDQTFMGWTTNPDYTAADKDNGMDIQEVRQMIFDKTINTTETLDLYAMIYESYNISFLDESGVVVRTDELLHRGNEGVEYIINEPYEPKEQDEKFEGWNVQSGGENVSGSAPYPNDPENPVTITGNVVFSVNAPKGSWLSFHENGGSYTPPQFIKKLNPGEQPSVANGTATERPEDPTKKGYTFGGWYENEELTGAQFTFGGNITTRTNLYAKWNPVSTATYTVIIWKQRVSDDKNATDAQKTYDVEEVITLSGNVGSTVNTVTQPNSNTNVATGRGTNVRNYSVNGSQKSYTGFHAARYDTGVTIAAEGTSVVNVYYDRNLITINFNAGNGRYIQNEVDGGYSQRVTYTGLYDAPLTFTWPAYYWTNANGTGTRRSNLWTHDSNNGGSTLTFYGSFKLYRPANVSETLTLASAGTTPIRFIKQKADGTWPANTDDTENVITIGGNGGDFTFSEKFSGFSVSQYRTSNYTTSDTGWNSVRNSSGAFRTVSNYSQLNIRFTRDKYPITYLDGTYFDGNGVVLKEATKAPLGESDEIYYEGSVTSYNADGADYYTPTAQSGYVFGGWYVDPTCTSPYTFTTMPAGGITVYAKWVQVQYRVFLHPNVPESDTSLEWGQTGQQMSFRVDYGDQINGGNTIKGERTQYEIIGQYTDEACTQPFNFDAYVLNDTTVTTQYNQTEDTELNKYGNPEQTGNKDKANNRFWIKRKLDLYAKWRSKLNGANGIGLEYDPGDGTNEPETDTLYLDSAKAVAGHASTPNNDDEKFMYWVVMNWNGSEFEPTDTIVYPGGDFTVLKANAKEEDLPLSEQTETVKKKYTVQLKAVYDKKESEKPTYIYWYPNGGSPSEIKKDKPLQINTPVNIRGADTYSKTGYRFIGWIKDAEPANIENAGATSSAAVWLHYNKDTDSFYIVKNGSNVNVSQVAADEMNPDQLDALLHIMLSRLSLIMHSEEQIIISLDGVQILMQLQQSLQTDRTLRILLRQMEK